MARRGKLTEAELGDWALYAQQVRPLKGKAAPPLPRNNQATKPRPSPAEQSFAANRLY